MDEMIYSLMEDSQFIDIMTADILDEGTLADSRKVMYKSETSKNLVNTHKMAMKAMKKNDNSEAKKLFNECIKLAKELKNEINNIDEPKNAEAKKKNDRENTGLALLELIIACIPFVNFIYLIKVISMSSKPHAQMYDNSEGINKTYEDKLSKMTGDQYKKQCQVALNNFINTCEKHIQSLK